jgi:hypothetical protein
MPHEPSSISYDFTEEDFERAFSFAVDYYLAKKQHTGRTSGEPRGLGAILDAFTMGKLVEIGVQRMLELANKEKKIILDFEMKSLSEVATEPDIIGIKEAGQERYPALFIEIKNTSQGDRWIGLTEEQLSAMKKGGEGKQIFIIYSSITSTLNQENPNSLDFVGMYLKRISKHQIFQEFASLNAAANLEFIISADELEKFGTKFPSGDLLYETELFEGSASLMRRSGELKSGISLMSTHHSFDGEIKVPRRDGTYDNEKGVFYADGSFNLYVKQNPVTKTHFIECLRETLIKNDVFGEFNLGGKKTYRFNMETVGRDPTLKRNNIWIAKRRMYQLINSENIPNPAEVLKFIAKNI